MTRVKICGITRIDDALEAAAAGADALGFVFAASPRRISPRSAREMVDRLPPFVRTVGVFVDAPLDEIERAVRVSGVDAVQLHGNETPGFAASLGRTLIRRVTVRQGDDPVTIRDRMRRRGVASACLLDPGAGSGVTFDWSLARGLCERVIVAGGLTPDNVSRAVRLAAPYAVDVSSGVEREPGIKDAEAMRVFVGAVRREDARHPIG